MKPRATEIEYLTWFRVNADFGPADGDVQDEMTDRFIKETGKNLPHGWHFYSDGKTNTDQ